jgi:hypothetical protein
MSKCLDDGKTCSITVFFLSVGLPHGRQIASFGGFQVENENSLCIWDDARITSVMLHALEAISSMLFV